MALADIAYKATTGALLVATAGAGLFLGANAWDIVKRACCITAIAAGVAQVSEVLRNSSTGDAGSTNSHGDKQLEVDTSADTLIFGKLKECGAVETASSEETSDMVALGGHGFSVAFDPVDGSSIYSANFAVGSIFGIWPGKDLLGRTGRELAAACYAVYGPRTVLVLSRPKMESSPEQVVQEFALITSSSDTIPDRWELQRDEIAVGEKKVFAPANLRSAAENKAYEGLMHQWILSKYTLRYTGGMVPDIHHIIAKGGGLFCNPSSKEAPAKLRLLYEAAPIAFIMEAAGGASHDGKGSVLDRRIQAAQDRSIISLGTKVEVEKSIAALQWQ